MPWDAAGLEKPLLVAKGHSHVILGSVPLGPGLAWEEGSLGLREGGPWPRNTLKGTRGAPAEGGGGSRKPNLQGPSKDTAGGSRH